MAHHRLGVVYALRSPRAKIPVEARERFFQNLALLAEGEADEVIRFAVAEEHGQRDQRDAGLPNQAFAECAI